MRQRVITLVTLSWVAALACADETERWFTAKPVWTSGSQNSGGDGNARWIDADRDGDLDLVTSAPGPRRWVLFQNENGALASTPSWGSEETTDCDHISVLDFNQDGWTDLAGTHESHCTLYLNGAGKQPTIFPTQPSWETGLYTDANQIDFGDFDNDGDLDMLMASGLPVYSVALFENQHGLPSRTVSRTIGPREYSETAVFSDIDADGDLDIVAAYGKTGRVVAFENENGKFGEAETIYQDDRVPWCQRIYGIDFDKDGSIEIFCAKGPWGPPGASVALSRQGKGTAWKVIWRSAPETGFHGFDFRDIDDDGDLDLAAADWGGRSVSVFLQDQGRLSTKPVWSARTTGPAHEVVLGDVDQDGDLDLAVGCLDQALVFENLR